MKLRLITTAALLAVAGSSHALSPAVIDANRGGSLQELVLFGASAQTPMVAAYMKNVVCAGAADYDDYKDTSGKNFFAYSCTLAAANGFPIGTKLLVVKRDQGGSVYGVDHVAKNIPGLSMIVSAANCPGWVHGTTATCAVNSTTAPYDTATPVAGISDVEPALFTKKFTKVGAALNQYLNHPDPATNDEVGNSWSIPTAAQINSMDIAATGQTIFGVAVTKTLRDKLQVAQGLGAGDAEVNTPSLPAAFIAGALSGFVRGGPVATFADWSAVTLDVADNNKNVVICRRTRGSGTQVVSNSFFLNMATQADTSLGMLAPLASGAAANTDGSPVGGVVVNEGAGTGDVENCLHVTHATDYALGVVSREKDPLINGKSYRFVRVDGALPKQSVARTGGYGMVYDSSMQWRKTTNPPSANAKTFLINMRSKAVTSNNISLYVGAEAKGGLLALPNRWQKTGGKCFTDISDVVNYDADDALYGSCVDRLNVLDTTYNPGPHVFGVAAYKTSSAGVLKLVR